MAAGGPFAQLSSHNKLLAPAPAKGCTPESLHPQFGLEGDEEDISAGRKRGTLSPILGLTPLQTGNIPTLLIFLT